MRTFIPSALAVEILSQLVPLRLQYASEFASPEQRIEAATEICGRYRRLGLTDRAVDWLHAVSPFSDGHLAPLVLLRYQLASVLVWLDREDAEAAARVLDKVRNTDLPLEEERTFLAASVRLSLLAHPADSFAPLERAFRHLRHHPSALWSARFLLWRALWQRAQGREDEVVATLKKALVEASASDDAEVQLLAWFAVAEGPGTGRTKAWRLAHLALEKAREWGIPAAVAEAQRVVSRLTGPRSPDSARAFQAFLDEDDAVTRLRGLWDRSAREEDGKIFEAAGQDRRRREAALLASIVAKLAREPSLSRSLDDLYQPLCSLMPADVFGIALWTPEQKALDYALFIEEGRRTRVGLIPVDSTRSLGAWCFRSQETVRINDIDREYGTYLKELSRLADHRPKSMLFQPLVSEGQPRGIITVQSFSRGAYGPEAESHLAIIAGCVALRLQAGSRSEDGAGEVSRH